MIEKMNLTEISEPDNETVFSYRFRKHADKSKPNQEQKERRWTLETFISISNVIHPFSPFKQIWDRFILLLVIFNSIVIPWMLAFKLNKGCDDLKDGIEDSCVSSSERWTSIVIDCVFWIDMLLSFRYGFVDKRMVIRMNDSEVFHRYLTRFLWIDLIANLPYYTIAASFAQEGSFEGRIAMNLYLLPKLLRTVRAFRCPGVTSFSSTIWRIAKMVSSFLMVSHWCGCIWYFIGRWEAETIGANTFTGNVSWIEVSLDSEHSTYLTADLRTKYTAAVYWAITTMSTVGYGEIVPQTNVERVFTVIVQFLGAISAAMILGQVAVLIANFNSSSQQFRDRRYQLDEYLKSRELPPELCKRARLSLQHTWNLHRGMNHHSILQELPTNMKADILELILTTEIQKSYLFEHCDRLFVRALVTKLQPETFAPDDYIYHEDDIASYLCYLRSGKVKVIDGEEHVVIDVLSEGDLFGETELLANYRRSNTIQALTAVDVQVLWRDDLEKLLDDFPEYRCSLITLSSHRREAFHQHQRAKLKNKDELVTVSQRGKLQPGVIKSAQTKSHSHENENILLDTARYHRDTSDHRVTKRKQSNHSTQQQKPNDYESNKEESAILFTLLIKLRENLMEINKLQDKR